METRHDAYLRELGGYHPNPTPFETGVPGSWAYNTGLAYVVPGSCPLEIQPPTYPTLTQDPPHPLKPINSSHPTLMSFTWDTQQDRVAREAGKQLYIAWVNQENQPRYTPLNVTRPGAGSNMVPTGLQAVAFAGLTAQKP